MSKKVKCKFCEKNFGCKKILEHYNDCIIEHFKDKPGYLLHIYSPDSKDEFYHLYILVGSDTKFKDIDVFLRDKWFNDDHMSQFSEVIDLFTFAKDKLVDRNTTFNELKMTEKIKKYDVDSEFKYDYDIGIDDTSQKRYVLES